MRKFRFLFALLISVIALSTCLTTTAFASGDEPYSKTVAEENNLATSKYDWITDYVASGYIDINETDGMTLKNFNMGNSVYALYQTNKFNEFKYSMYAKLNLTLEVGGVENGFHQLDSLCATVDIFDEIHAKKRKDNRIVVTMRGLGSEAILPQDNNAQKAAEAFVRTFQTTGADITVFKNIPIGAGLGGSSADAAGVLRAMARLYAIHDEDKLFALACSLGSDTAYMLTGGFARMQERGDKITPLHLPTTLYALLLCPLTPISTKACFERYDCLPKTLEWKESATQNCIAALLQNNVNEAGRYLMNDLFTAAMHVNPDVEKTLSEAQSFSPLGATMTGSGSAVFALFENRELCEWAKSRYQGSARAYVVETVSDINK